MPQQTKTLNAGESTGTQPVDHHVNPNITVTNTSAVNLAAFEIAMDNSPTPTTKPLGKSGDLDFHAEMCFNVKCVSGQIRVDWED